MLSKQKQIIESYQRVQEFLAAHPVQPPTSYDGPKAILDVAVARLTVHSADQATGKRLTRAQVEKQRVLASTLRTRHLKPIAQIARSVLKDAPGIDAALTLPSASVGVTKLIAEARAMRVAAEQYDPAFVSNGRPADFLARLDEAIEALRVTIPIRARVTGTRVGAGAGIAMEIRRGRSAVEMLDAIVQSSFVDQGDVLARWRLAKRVQGLAGGGGPAATGGTAEENLPLPSANAA